MRLELVDDLLDRDDRDASRRGTHSFWTPVMPHSIDVAVPISLLGVDDPDIGLQAGYRREFSPVNGHVIVLIVSVWSGRLVPT